MFKKMQGKNSQRTHIVTGLYSIRVLRFEILKLPCLLMCFMTTFQGLQSQEIISTTKITFCYNSSLQGFRLNAPVLEVRNVSSRSACVDDCFAHPCCRAMNYNRATTSSHSSNCELLHDLVEKTSYALEPNSSFHYLFFNEPVKEYNVCCIPEESEKHRNKRIININICSFSPSPCLNDGSCVVNGSTGYLCICPPGYSGTRCEKTYNSCKDVLDNNSSASDGVYHLKLNENAETYPVYCHMSGLYSKCGGGGWTLVMKLARDEETFKYGSSMWTNKKTLNVEEGLDGLTQIETKLASYHYTPFTKICLGMTRDDNDETNWILVNYAATSLFSVIANGNYHRTNAGRAKWVSLIRQASLQSKCNKEGFNVKCSEDRRKSRIGMISSKKDNCKSCGSVIGFGIRIKHWSLSSGNINNLIKWKTFGYIFVQ